MKTLFLTLLLGGVGYSGSAQVLIGKGNNGTNICSNLAADGTTPGFTTLGQISIVETNTTDIASAPNDIVEFNAPAGWQFNSGVTPSVTFTGGGDIASISNITISSTTLSFKLHVTGTTLFDEVDITGLQVQALTSSASAGGVVASLSQGSINGLPSADMADLSLKLSVTPAVTIAASPSNVVCSGTTVTFTPSPSNATTPSYQWYVNGSCGACVASPTFSSNTFVNGDIVRAQMSSHGTCETNSTPFSPPVTMTVNSNPSISSANASPASLCVGSTLNLTSSATGGFGGYSFSWNGPGPFSAPGQNVSNTNIQTSGTGVYTVTVTDGNLCKGSLITNPVTVNTNPSITAINASPTSLCVGATLNLTSTVTGGGGSNSYTWTGNGGYSATSLVSSNATETNIQTGNNGIYTLVVTDANTCTVTASTLPVTVNTNPSITAIGANPSSLCVGASLNLTSTVTGGGGGNSYTWTGNGYSSTSSSPNATETNIQVGNGGSYTLVVTDVHTCTVTASTSPVTVNVNPTITSIGASPNPICVGTTLTLTTTTTGGGGGNSYTWTGNGYSSTSASPNATETNIQTSNAGIYTLVVTDANTCTVTASTSSVLVNVNPTITASADPNPLCVGKTLALSSTPSGGSGSFPIYAWSGPDFSGGGQNPSIASVATTDAGVYSVTVTDSHGCMGSAITQSVTVNTNPTVAVSFGPNPICASNTLTMTATPAGGSGIYSNYSWTGPNSFVSASQSTSVPSIQTINQGVYSVTVTDNNGCKGSGATSAIIVNTNPTITASVTPTPICVGGTLNLSSFPVGGSSIYSTFAWSGPGFSSISASPNATNANITAGGAGVYSVTVTDSHGCIGTATTPFVIVNTNPTITTTVTPNPICVGNTLNLESTPGGGNSGFYPTYVWHGPNSFVAGGQNTTVPNIQTNGAGIYSVTVTDGNGCMGSTTTALEIVFVNPVVTASVVPNPICVGSTLVVSSIPSGGGGSYSYAWTGPNAFTATTQTSNITSITTVAAGVYSVTITDNNGCKATAGTPIVVVNTNPTITASVTPNPICVNSTLTLNSTPAAGSGSSFTSFVWHGPTAFIVSGQSAVRANIQTTGAGIYTVTVTDNNGCQAMGMTPIVVVNTNPTITATVTPNPICVGNTVTLNSTPTAGSSSNFVSFAWNGPGPFTGSGQSTTNPNITTGGTGIYSVTVTDDNGCIGNGVTLPLVVNTNPTLTATVTPNPICVGSTVALNSTRTGGTGPFVFAWSGPGSYIGAGQNTTNPNITTNGAGVYSVTVTDNHGCIASATTASLTVNTNPTITANATPNPLCVNSTLALNSTPVAGSGSSFTTFAWTGPSGYTSSNQNDTRASIQTTGAGIYSVTVTDNNGCKGSDHTLFVTVHTNPTITATVTPNPICVGNTLALNSTPAGGGGLYNYVWSGPGLFTATTRNTTNPSITTAGAGVYSVVVTDNNGCVGSVNTALVTVNTNPTITATATPNPICSGRTLSLNSTPVQGSGSSFTSFAWSGPGLYTASTQNASNASIQLSGAGVYNVSVTDNNGCQGFATTTTVTVNASPTISATASPNPICVGNTLALNSNPSGGSGTYSSFAWNGPGGFSIAAQNTTITGVAVGNSGVYTVTVTDNNNCTGSATTPSVVVNPLPVTFTMNGGGPYCLNGAGVHIGLNGSQTGVSYQLFFGATLGVTVAGTGSAIDFGLFTTAGGPYTAVATNTVTLCTSNMLSSVTVTILPLPAVFNVTGGGTFCANGAGVDIGLDGSVSGFSYQLYDGITPVGGAVAGTGSAIDFGFQTTVATYTVLASDDISHCNNEMGGDATVDTFPLPTVYTVSGGGTLCSGSAGYFIGLNGSQTGINYQLYNGTSPVGAAMAGNGGALNFGVFTTAGTYTVNATNASTGCKKDMAGNAVFIVNPLPTVYGVTGGGGYCAIGGTGVNVGLNGSDPGVNYQLYNGSNPVGSLVPGTGSALDFGPQFAAGTYSVSATTFATSCMNNMSGSTVVVINNNPTVYTVTGGGAYCVGGAGVNVGLSGSDAGVTYQTLLNGVSFGVGVSGTGSVGAFNIGIETTVGTYSVLATNQVNGCASMMSGGVAVDTNSLPQVFNVTGGGAYCFSGAGIDLGLDNSAANVNYQLYNGSTPVGAVMPGGSGAIDFNPQFAAGTYSVLATDINNCMNGMSGTPTIVVNPLPDAITAATAVCTGGITTFADDSTGGAWTSNAPGIAAVGSLNGIVSGVAAGSATITYTLPTTCFVTASITVNQTPGSITGSSTVCAGSSTPLTDALAGGTWSNTAVSIATVDASGNVFGVSAGSDNITYSMPTGCFITTLETVNPLPVIPAIGATTTAVCENATITYTDGLSGGTWSSDNSGVASIDPSTGIITGILNGTATITYLVTNGFSCTSSVTQGVTVNPVPGVAIISAPADVCAGASVTLTDGTTGGVWSSGNTSATVNSTGVVTGVAAGTAIISYTVTNGFGCSTTTITSLPVGSPMPASAVLPVGSATLCGGNPVNMSVVSSGGTPTTYQWLYNGTIITGADSATYMADSAGLYTAILGNGTCELTLTGSNIVAAPNPVILYDSVSNIIYTGSFSTYEWFFNGNPIPGANSSVITPTGNGLYSVVVSDGNGCSDTVSFAFGVVTGVPTQQVAKNIRIYPNPVTSLLYIDAPVKVFVSVLSPDGKVLIERKEAVSLNVSGLTDGMYLIMIYDENNTLLRTDKFVKMQ